MQGQPFPRPLPKNVSAQELRVFFADLLDWLPRHQMTALIACGLTQNEIETIHQIADDYRRDEVTSTTTSDLHHIIGKLEMLNVMV